MYVFSIQGVFSQTHESRDVTLEDAERYFAPYISDVPLLRKYY